MSTQYDASLHTRYSADAGALTEEMRVLQGAVRGGLADTVGALGTLRELEGRMDRLEGNVLTASAWGAVGVGAVHAGTYDVPPTSCASG